MKISKSKIKNIVKKLINERMNTGGINFNDLIRGGSLPPPPTDDDHGGGGGGGKEFVFLIALARKLVEKEGFYGGTKFTPISTVDELLRAREEDMDQMITLEKEIMSIDNKEIGLSVILDFEEIEASFFVSCFDPEESYTDIIDGFSIKIKSNFKYIEALNLIRSGVNKVKKMSSTDILDAGNSLLTK